MLRLGLADCAIARFELLLEDIEEQSTAVVPYSVVLGITLEEGGDLLESGICEIAGFDLERDVSLSLLDRDLLWYKGSDTPFRPPRPREICTARSACAPFLLRPHSCRPRRRRGERRAGQSVNLTSHACTHTYSFLHYLRLPWRCVSYDRKAVLKNVRSNGDVDVRRTRRGQRWRARRCSSHAHGLERMCSLRLAGEMTHYCHRVSDSTLPTVCSQSTPTRSTIWYSMRVSMVPVAATVFAPADMSATNNLLLPETYVLVW